MYMIQYIYTWNLYYFLHVCKAKDQGSLEQLLLRNAVFDLRFEAGGNGMTREALVLCLTIGKNAASIARQKKNRRNRASDQGPASRKRLPLEPHALFARRSEGACLEIGYRIVRSGQSNSAAEFSNPLSSRNRWRISCLYSLPLRSVYGDEVPTRATRVPCPVSRVLWPLTNGQNWTLTVSLAHQRLEG